VMAGRLKTLLRRSFGAARLGFRFVGTTRSEFPRKVRLARQLRTLSVPSEGGYLYDVINIWLDDEYGLKALSFIPRSVVDIGANVGLFSLWARHCFPDARIDAYEPNTRVLRFAEQNVAGLGINVFPEGVGSVSGMANLVDDGESRLASTSRSTTGQVVIRSLADVVERAGGEVDLLKLDCEGAEWEILTDRQSMARVRCLRMEYHLVDGKSLSDFETMAKLLSFDRVKVFPNDGFGIAWLQRSDVYKRQSSTTARTWRAPSSRAPSTRPPA